MNIFVVDENPHKAAQMLCDKHIGTMMKEACQMMCTAAVLNGAENTPYKPTHRNHPCTKWVAENSHNFMWLFAHADELSKEWTFRFKSSHKSQLIVPKCLNLVKYIPIGQKMSPFTQAMPDEFKSTNAVDAYRNYYWSNKYRFAKWERGRNKPEWWNE